MFPDDAVGGGVQVGLIGVGGCAGAGAGDKLGAGAGVIVTSGTAHPAPSTSRKMAVRIVSIKLVFMRNITILIVT
jgi:hypothetical protein